MNKRLQLTTPGWREEPPQSFHLIGWQATPEQGHQLKKVTNFSRHNAYHAWCPWQAWFCSYPYGAVSQHSIKFGVGLWWCPQYFPFLGFVDRKSRFFTNIFFQIDLFCERCIPVFLQILVDDPLCVQRPGHLRLMNLKYKARFSLSFGRKCNIILQTIVTVFYLLIQPIKVVIHVWVKVILWFDWRNYG